MVIDEIFVPVATGDDVLRVIEILTNNVYTGEIETGLARTIAGRQYTPVYAYQRHNVDTQVLLGPLEKFIEDELYLLWAIEAYC